MDGKLLVVMISIEIENKYLKIFIVFWLSSFMFVEFNSKKIGFVKKNLSFCVCIIW